PQRADPCQRLPRSGWGSPRGDRQYRALDGCGVPSGCSVAQPPPMSMFPREALSIVLWGLLAGSSTSCVVGEIRDRHAAAVDSYLGTPFIDPNQPFMEPTRALG